jgi:conjugative transfer signal peptidase TraF
MTNGLLDRGKKSPFKRIRDSALLSAGILIGVFQILDLLGIRINTSPSLPLGLYRVTSDRRDSLIEFCPVEPFAEFAIERGYRDQGICSDGAAPLLKPIAARVGDVVEFSKRGIAVNGRLLPNTAPLGVDTEGRPLIHWRFGRFKVQAGELWVASSYNRRSFDSRYFGPVPVNSVRERLYPLFTAW